MAINYIEEKEEEDSTKCFCPGCDRPLTSLHYDQSECAYVCPDCDTMYDPEYPDYYNDDDDDDDDD